MIWLKSGRFFPSNPPWHRHKKGQHHTIYITTNICLLGTVNRGKFADKGIKRVSLKKTLLLKPFLKIMRKMLFTIYLELCIAITLLYPISIFTATKYIFFLF